MFAVLGALATSTVEGAGIHFSVWQSILVMIVVGFSAVMAHKALAVFNDGARPFMLDFIQGRTSRMETATVVFGLSAGFIFGVGAPMALSTGVLNPWLLFLPAEILGLLAPKWWIAAAAGLGWGAISAFGLAGVNNIAQSLPVNFIAELGALGTPILWLFAMFPVLAVARQFGRTKALITFAVEAAMILLAMNVWPTVFAGSLAMAAGVFMLIGFAAYQDRAARATETIALAGMTDEERAIALQAKVDEAEAVDQLFGPNALRLRQFLPWFMALGGLVAALSATHIFAGSAATSFLIASGDIVEAAQTDFWRAFGFVPLVATTALASGAYAMAGFTFVYPVGYLIGLGIANPILALILAFAAGAAIFGVEVLALSALGRFLQRWPSIRESADHIRNAIGETLQTALLVGSLMVALNMAGGLGVFIVGGLYLLNEALGRPIARLAAGPAAVILAGILLNVLNVLNIFTP